MHLEIDYVDLRDNTIQEGIDSKSLFFRTYHHGTVPAAKWAAQIIAQKLNDTFGYKTDMSLYDDSAFNIVGYKECWLDEQGHMTIRAMQIIKCLHWSNRIV